MRYKGKNNYCYICGAKNITMFMVIDKTYSLVKCERCYVIFTIPHLMKAKRVNESLYGSKDEFTSRISNIHFEYKRAKNHINYIQKYKKSGKYLDIGCSYGISLKVAKDMGFTAIGIEPTKRAANYAKKILGLKVIEKSLFQVKFAKNSFDVITLYDVLEHIPDPSSLLVEIKQILKQKGLIVIQSPNIESIAFSILKDKWNWLLPTNHIWHFSINSIKYLLEKEGFTIIDYKTNDNVFDFTSNLKSKIYKYNIPNSYVEKVLQKSTYSILYLLISLCTKVWCYLGKGGVMQIYAIKK